MIRFENRDPGLGCSRTYSRTMSAWKYLSRLLGDTAAELDALLPPSSPHPMGRGEFTLRGIAPRALLADSAFARSYGETSRCALGYFRSPLRGFHLRKRVNESVKSERR